MNARRISVKKLFENVNIIQCFSTPRSEITRAIEQRQKRIVKNEYETKW